jgi:hypothetical protein
MRDHRTRLAGALAAALALAGLAAAPAVMATDELRSRPLASAEIITHELSAAPGSPIHFGGGTAEDAALALDVADALAADPRLEGATITVAANNGEVMINGSAENPVQADIAEQTARRVAGVMHVAGTLSSTAG